MSNVRSRLTLLVTIQYGSKLLRIPQKEKDTERYIVFYGYAKRKIYFKDVHLSKNMLHNSGTKTEQMKLLLNLLSHRMLNFFLIILMHSLLIGLTTIQLYLIVLLKLVGTSAPCSIRRKKTMQSFSCLITGHYRA